jgi:hypothetical protein
VKLRELLTKINDAVRPVQVGERGASIDDKIGDAYETVQARGVPPTDWAASQQRPQDS